MKRSFLFHFMWLLMVVTIYVSCDRSDSLLNPGEDIIRASVSLSADNIPALNGATAMYATDRPWLLEAGWEEAERYYVVRFSYYWESDDTNSVDVDVVIAGTAELAYKYLIERRTTGSIPPDLLEPQDQPAIVGDISFGNGREFIRDNIVIVIRPSGKFEQKVPQISEQIDQLLLKSPTAKSAAEMKPVIDNFGIEKNPVQFRSSTRLLIEATDPMHGALFYDWRFTPGSENWGGIEIDQSGNYYYYADTAESTEELTLISMNEYGFYSSSTIYIQVEPE